VASDQSVGTQHRLMVALPARHVERAHAVLPHVAESHRLRPEIVVSTHTGEDNAAAWPLERESVALDAPSSHPTPTNLLAQAQQRVIVSVRYFS
jgi:hypothetical protein